jgi:hypothetical protein
MVDKLVLLDAGESAINNANAGGLLINPASFRMGDSDLYPSSTQHTNIVGNFVTGGEIHHVEVLSAKTARFVLSVDTRSLAGPTTVKEVVIFFEGNIAFARCVFAKPYILQPDEPLRLSVVLGTSRADLTTISVIIGEHDSIPATPFLYRLPPPGNSEFNAISVLNGMRHFDGTNGPVLAQRYGAGAFQWAFSEHQRVFNGVPTSATATSFKIPNQSWAANEQVIVHVVSGSGEGKTRRYRYNTAAAEFRDVDNQPIPNLQTCTIAVWRMVGTSTGSGAPGAGLPPTDNIPNDWVLTPGPDGTGTWQPPKAASKIIATLYTKPTRLEVNALTFMGTGDQSRYSTGELIAENANYIYPALGMATQHRTAFELNGSELEFAEVLPSTIPVDLRVFTRSPSTGTRVLFKTIDAVGDGETVEFDIGFAVDSAAHVFAFISSMLQPVSTYTFDAITKKIRFISPPAAGLPIEFRCLTYVNDTGYSTRIVTRLYNTDSDTFFLKLPTTPQSIEQVFVSQSGAHVHQENYSLIEDGLVFTESLEKGVEVEVMIFENIQAQGSEATGLNGIVIDGYVTNKNITLLRHGAPAVMLPIPAPAISVGKGLQIDASSGQALISIDAASFPNAPVFTKWSIDQIEKNQATIIVTQRIDLTKPCIIFVTCDFAAKLGPGYVSTEGAENMEYVVGIRSSQSKEPDFGRAIRGTNTAGLFTGSQSKSTIGYANASMTQMFELDPSNHNTGYVELVAKMRINNANTSQFTSLLTLNFNALEIPK